MSVRRHFQLSVVVAAVCSLPLAAPMGPRSAVAETGGGQTSGARVIGVVEAVASSVYGGAVGAHHLIDPSRLNQANEHIGRSWGGNWLSGEAWDTGDHWVYIDLGADYCLDEIRIWNYHENERAGAGELRGRGVKACSLWVASSAAAVPSARLPGGEGGDVFVASNGWSRLIVILISVPGFSLIGENR